MKKFLAVLAACTTVFTSTFICNKANAEDHGKAVFLGNCSVYKSRIIGRISKDCKESETNTDFTTVKINTDGSDYKVYLYDTAGQEKYKSFIPATLHDAGVTVVCCNYGNRDSFDSIKDWINLTRANSDCKIILIAISTIVEDNCEEELDPSKWQFSADEVEKLGNDLKVDYTFTKVSAKTGCSISDLVRSITNLCYEYGEEHKNVPKPINWNDTTAVERKGCC